MKNPMMLGPSRFKDGIPVATDTDPDGDYDVLNIADLRPNKKHKFASAGTKYYTVDCGSPKTADALGFRTHNLQTANASVSVETGGMASVVTDDFSDSSFDTANFGSVVAGTGSVVETTLLTTDSWVGASAAIVYDKNTLTSRNELWAVSHHYQVQVAGPGAAIIMLYESAAAPSVGSTPMLVRTELKACIYQETTDIRFIYRDTSGVLHYWDGSAWGTVLASAYASALSTNYVAKMYSDGIRLFYELWDSTGTTQYAAASIALSLVQQDGNTDYLIFGDVQSNVPGVRILSTLWDHTLLTFSTEVLSPFTPANDRAFLKTFPSAESRFWRVKIVTASIAAYAGVVLLGDILEWPKPPDAGYMPTRLKTAGWTNRSKLLEAIGKGKRGRTRKDQLKYGSIVRSWLLGTFLPLYRSYYADNPFLYCWNLDDPYADVIFAWIPEGYEFKDALTVMERVDKFVLDLEAREEPV